MGYVETVCARDCYDTCFMKVLISNDKKPNRIVGEKTNPVTQGFLCPRGIMAIKRTYSSERVLFPHKMVGEKPHGSFKRISWDDALDTLVEKLRHVMENFGSSAALHLYYSGNMGLLTQYFPQRLFYALGFSQTDLSICSKSGHEALKLHYGLSYGVDSDELSSMKLTVYWGFNAAVSAPHLHALSLKAKRDGGAIVVVDPRKSETAKLADFWIQPNPGSDVALAYGVMKCLIENELVDLDFIEKNTCGFKKLKEMVLKWMVESVEDYTGVEWKNITRLAQFYADFKPSVTMIGIGMQKSLYGAESVRAVSLIPALVGLHRGFYYSNSKCWNINLPYLTGEELTDKKVKGVSQVALGKHLERGDFKFVYIHNMNPAQTLPNQKAVREGLARKDVFVVVHDTHWTETTKFADLVLPARTFLEKEDVVISYSHKYVRKSKKVIEPLGESKSELWIMTNIVKRLGLKEKWLYEDPWKAVGRALEKAFENGDFSELNSGKVLRLKMKPKNKYQTPTGKIEFYSTKAEKLGFSPLPKQHPLQENEDFILLNTAMRKFTHTQFQEVFGPLPPIVLVNPEDAKEHLIKDDDIVELRNKLGSIKLKAAISDALPKRVLWTPREGKDIEGKPQNVLMPDTTQSLGGGPAFNSTKVKLKVFDK
ncbi:MAG: molybdopterin-dependent oxidoreductase [Candidatus Bathycorpusculaceae bacterium]